MSGPVFQVISFGKLASSKGEDGVFNATIHYTYTKHPVALRKAQDLAKIHSDRVVSVVSIVNNCEAKLEVRTTSFEDYRIVITPEPGVLDEDTQHAEFTKFTL